MSNDGSLDIAKLKLTPRFEVPFSIWSEAFLITTPVTVVPTIHSTRPLGCMQFTCLDYGAQRIALIRESVSSLTRASAKYQLDAHCTTKLTVHDFIKKRIGRL